MLETKSVKLYNRLGKRFQPIQPCYKKKDYNIQYQSKVWTNLPNLLNERVCPNFWLVLHFITTHIFLYPLGQSNNFQGCSSHQGRLSGPQQIANGKMAKCSREAGEPITQTDQKLLVQLKSPHIFSHHSQALYDPNFSLCLIMSECTKLPPSPHYKLQSAFILSIPQGYISLSWRPDECLGTTERQLERGGQIQPPELSINFPCASIPCGCYHQHPAMHGY